MDDNYNIGNSGNCHSPFKRFCDIFLSGLLLVVMFPFCIIFAIIIKIESKGPIIYSQERLGRYGLSFTIYKLRSMYNNAEGDMPALSCKNDPRVTLFGKIMRRFHIDEIPQLINILKGEMTFVGPRPERVFFVNEIIKTEPKYLMLQKVKPGLMSFGQLEFGYAYSVDEMIERMHHDLKYLDKISILTDLNIIYRSVIKIAKRLAD